MRQFGFISGSFFFMKIAELRRAERLGSCSAAISVLIIKMKCDYATFLMSCKIEHEMYRLLHFFSLQYVIVSYLESAIYQFYFVEKIQRQRAVSALLHSQK